MPRWGNPEGGEFHEVPFGVRLDGERRAGGCIEALFKPR